MFSKTLSNKKNITIGIALSFLTLFISLLLHIFYTRFLVNSVGDEQYGIYSYATSITNWLLVLSSAVFSAYIRFVTIKQKENGEEGVKSTNSLFLLLFVIFDVIAILFLGLIFVLLYSGVIEYQNKDLLSNLLLISGIQVILSIPANIFSLYITYKGKHIWIKLMNLCSTLLPPIISIPFLINGCSISTVLLIQCVVLIGTYLLNLSYSVFHLKQSFKIGKGFFDKTFLKEVALFSFFMILIEIVDKLNATSDQIILGSMDKGNYVGLVTVYQLSFSFSEFFAALSLAIVTVFIPMIHESVIANKKEKMDKVYIYIYTLQLFVLFLFFGGFLSCGKEFIYLWKPEHPEIFLFALILLFIRLVPLSQNSSYEIQKARNKYRYRSIVNFVFAIINVGISIAFLFILGFSYGIYACLIGTVFSTLVSKWFLISRYNRKTIGLNMKRYWISVIKSFFVVGVSSLFAITVRQLLVYAELATIFRFLIVGSIFTVLFCVGFLLLFVKDIIEIFYVLRKKKNVLFTNCDKYLKKGTYRINPLLNVLYLNKEYAFKFNNNCLSKNNVFFIKKILSFFYINKCRDEDNEINGEIIYRSANRLHIFNYKDKRHYLVFDSLEDLEAEIQNRSEEYPFDKPIILFIDKQQLLICEELIEKQENKDDLIKNVANCLSKSKYNKKSTITIEEYIKRYNFEDKDFEKLFTEKIYINLKHGANIDLYFTHGDLGQENLILSNDKLIAIDWEVAGLAPFYYDFIHYLMSDYIRNGNGDRLHKYFDGSYDDLLKSIFKANDEIFDSSLRQTYYYICVLTRLILFRHKDGLQFEKMLIEDKFWLECFENEK